MDKVKSVRIYLSLQDFFNYDVAVLANYQAEWLRLCEILAGMKGLKELRIKFHTHHTSMTMRWTRHFDLDPLRKLSNLTVFQVYVPWRDYGDVGDVPVPFQLLDIRQWPQQ